MDKSGTGGRAFHGVGQPDIEGKLRRLSACPNEEKQCGHGNNRIADGEASTVREMRNFGKSQRAEIPRDEKHPQQKPGVADAVDDDRLVTCVRSRLAMKIETYQQIPAQANPFPPDK